MKGRALKILLVEDNRLHAAMAADLLALAEPPGFESVHVETLGEAEKILETTGFDLILLDLTLPDAQGMTVVTRLRDRAMDIPIVILTALHDEASAIKALQHGAQDYLIKGQVDGDLIVRAIRHAIERERLETRVRHLAYFDVLTDLPNRTLFYDRINQALSLAKRHKRVLGVLVLDLDNFKSINDTLGHSVGDRLLGAVAERLTGVIRASDSLARMGGDEFALLLPEVKCAEDISVVAERILSCLEVPCVLDRRELFVCASIGACIYPQDGQDAETLLKNADTAMYQAKKTGGGNVRFYTQLMNVRSADRLAIRNSLPYALERDQLRLHYQPTMDLASGELVGVEALLRWEHPERGLMPPLDFIPLAEETGLILPIGAWVIQKACEQSRIWREKGHPPLRMSVNLSVRQLQDENLVEVVLAALEEGGMAPEDLELELTEAGIVDAGGAGLSVLRVLKERGVRLAIDDFGTGYSSFQYLRWLPVEVLKIDKSFIDNLASDDNDAAIVKSIITLARNLGLETVAEGVETEAQARFLRAHGCDRVQGYLFSPPRPPQELERSFRRAGADGCPPAPALQQPA